MDSVKKISIQNSEVYTWGDNCKGWHFLKSPKIGIIYEMMPPGTEETRHRHLKAQQFFFMLKGSAVFELEGKSAVINANEGIHIEPGKVHRIKNESDSEIEFMVISEPHAHGDREII